MNFPLKRIFVIDVLIGQTPGFGEILLPALPQGATQCPNAPPSRPLPEPKFSRGYGWMFARHVGQADAGCDFNFLEKGFGPATGEPDIY